MSQKIRKFLRKILDLREGSEEKDVIIENVKDDSDFSSPRFWTLVFAIGVASVGLNINSVPVVIGAMLISPLMGPIFSVSLALAINDWGLMRRSLRNLSILVVISIVISAIYFALSPISNAQSELLSRIQPTIFDVLIAIFGGAVGFIGVSRERYNNIIPGAAIATALIPPLCTVGYGIGTWQIEFIFGAFYLFLINCIFICLSALLVAKYLKLPKVKYTSEDHQKKVRRIITAIIIIITTPAIFLAITFVRQNNFTQNADKFIASTFTDKGSVIIYKNISYSATKKSIELAFLSDRFSDEQITEFEERMKDFSLVNTTLNIRQNGQSMSDEELRAVLSEVKSNDEKMLALEALLKSEQTAGNDPVRVLEELKTINPLVSNISIGNLESGLGDVEQEAVVIIYSDENSRPLNKTEADMIANWLSKRLQQQNLLTYFNPSPVDTEEVPSPEDVTSAEEVL